MINIGEILILIGCFVILALIMVEYFRRKMDAMGALVGKQVVRSVFEDEEIAASVVDSVVKVISNHFASKKATSKREQKFFDKKLVQGLLRSTNPIVPAVLEEIGLLGYVEERPQLVFYALSHYPQLFQGAQMPEKAEMLINK